MKNPQATILMNSGNRIVIELRPDYAYNEVCSFISAASHGYYDHFAIQRIVPGKWIDSSYSAYFHKECQYYLPNRIAEESKGEIKVPELGDICLGYHYGDTISGTEFFLPLKRCEELVGSCPVFGQIIEGLDEVLRIAEVETFTNPTYPDVEINQPKMPEIIVSIAVYTFGEDYPEPEKIYPDEQPRFWPKFND